MGIDFIPIPNLSFQLETALRPSGAHSHEAWIMPELPRWCSHRQHASYSLSHLQREDQAPDPLMICLAGAA